MNIGIPLHPTTRRSIQNFISNPTHALIVTGDPTYGTLEVAYAISTTLTGKKISEVIKIAPSDLDTISIKDIHLLTSHIKHRPKLSEGFQEAFIIQTAETMTREAQNAFLKLLEEPPPGVLFVLTSDQSNLLIETIRSRSQLINIYALPKGTSIQYAKNQLGISDEEAEKLYIVIGGGIATVTKNQPLDQIYTRLSGVKKILEAKVFDRLIMITSIAKDRQAALQFVLDIEKITRIALLNAADSDDINNTKLWIERSKLVEKTLSNLKKNGNIKLSLDYLLVGY